MELDQRQLRTVWVTALILLTIKGVFLALYGPLFLPDSGGYTVYADRILTDRTWFHSLDLSAGWRELTAFRSIGYPLFIALTKLIAGEAYHWLAVILQIALSLSASFLIFRLASEVTGRFWVGWFCGVAHAVSFGLLLDQCILTDSLNASLLILLAALLGLGISREEMPRYLKLLGLGMLLALAFLVREAGNILQVLYWPFVLYWVVKYSHGWGARIGLFAAFILPMVVFTQVYKGWNEYRSGERFVTTASQTTMYMPALMLKQKGINVFADDPFLKDLPPYREPLDQVSPMINIALINNHLVKNQGFNAVDNARYAYQKYFGIWADYPLEMLKQTFSELRSKQLFLALKPAETMMTIDFWATGQKPFNKKRDLFEKVKTDNRYDLLVAYIARQVFRIISAILTITFVFAVPIVFIRHFKAQGFQFKELERNFVLIFMFWLIYFGYTFAYAMVHLEQRYLLPVVPLSTVAGMFVLAGPLENLWVKARMKLNGGTISDGR